MALLGNFLARSASWKNSGAPERSPVAFPNYQHRGIDVGGEYFRGPLQVRFWRKLGLEAH